MTDSWEPIIQKCFIISSLQTRKGKFELIGHRGDATAVGEIIKKEILALKEMLREIDGSHNNDKGDSAKLG